jgi:hypothetical protein
VSGDGAVSTPSESNKFFTSEIYASGYVTGQVASVINHEFFSKTQALEAAESIIENMQTLVVWRDANYAAIGEVDTGASYQQLQELVAITAGFLVEISFSLKQERTIFLDRPRTIIDLAAELYGEVDGSLDFLINSNSLTGSEILELPEGKEIVYYV